MEALEGVKMNVTQSFVALGGLLSLAIYYGLSSLAASLRRRHELRQRISQESRVNRWRGF